MRQDPPLPSSESVELAVYPNLTSTHLRVHSAQLKLFSNYEQLLQASVFPYPLNGLDSKTLKKHRRVLRSKDAYQILAFIWKESDFVNDEAATQAGIQKVYDGKTLTAHNLATALAENNGAVASLNSRIRNIAIAGSSFELVERVTLNSTSVPLKGTPVLNQFMTSLAAQNLSLLTEFSIETHPATSPSVVGQER